MSMRAPATESTGTSGQSYVKAAFEELGWGAVPNPEHDLGTDLWLMPRDENRFDLGALAGAQVKNGKSFFGSPVKDIETGEVTGWWYAESDDSHFDYWNKHAVPHILILRNPETKLSYWVHITSEATLSTGKGNKILVPIGQLVDAEHREGLTAVATSSSKAGSWAGSAWNASRAVVRSERLRYALMAPRLIAPHPNKGDVVPDAEEALALLVKCRFRDIESVATADKRSELAELEDAGAWEWQLFDAARSWIHDDDMSGLEGLSKLKSDPYRAAAVAAVHAAALIERGRPGDALTVVQVARTRYTFGPVDLAWLKSHEARCLQELGRLAEARDLALEVQQLRATAPSDPTASALVAVTTTLVFDMSGFGQRDIGELIQSIDTPTRWWRSQTVASALEKHFDKQFKTWGRDTSVTVAATDTVWTNLRSATLQAGLAADHDGWRHAMSLLARRELMRASSAASIVESLTDLLRAGAEKDLMLSIRKFADDGPVSPLQDLASQLDLALTPRSSLKSALSFIRYAGDLIRCDDADRHAVWLLGVLEDLEALRQRLKPRFRVADAVLDALGGLMLSVSPTVKRRIMNHVLALPAIDDQTLAGGYGKIVKRVGQEDWTDDDVARFSSRSGDNWELQDDIDDVLAVHNPVFRESLLERIKTGDLGALNSFGKVTDLPSDVAATMIAHLEVRIEADIAQARRGVHSFGGQDTGLALVVINAWHPGVARWSSLEALLSERNCHPDKFVGAMEALGRLSDQVPDDQKKAFRPLLEAMVERPTYEHDSFFAVRTENPQATAELALCRFFPEEVDDVFMQKLLIGSSDERAIAAKVLGDKADISDLNLLFLLSGDTQASVRVAAIVALARWVAQEIVSAAFSATLRQLIDAEGPMFAKTVSGHLLDMAESESRDVLLTHLEEHPSAVVRARVGLARKPKNNLA